MDNLTQLKDEAGRILQDWKSSTYVFGSGVLGEVGRLAKPLGSKALLAAADLGQPWLEPLRRTVERSLTQAGLIVETVLGAGPNAPLQDLYRLALQLKRSGAEVAVALGGGSTIDALKAATVLAAYSPAEVREVLGAGEALASTIDPYFGTGLVTKVTEATGRKPLPLVAVMTAASSAAHLTLAANITDPVTSQKRLILDPVLYPAGAVFDYDVTLASPRGLTVDGGLDGIAHLWEVVTGAARLPNYAHLLRAAEVGLRLIIAGLGRIDRDPQDREGRALLGLGTDVGGYLLMKGAGTHGPHLGSFSLVDILSHGRGCAVLNPYYTVLFASATQEQLGMAARVFHEAGRLPASALDLAGRELGLAVARAMVALWRELGFPVSLGECGATPAHLEKMIAAAKNPQLKMKLNQMPVPMDAAQGDVDRLMRPTLEAALVGDLERVP